MRSPATSSSTAATAVVAGAHERFPTIAVVAATIVALALRVPGLLQEPWIDEVWTWGLVRGCGSIGDVLSIRSSNSHAANSLWIWLAGDRATFAVYRIPSFIAGVACVPLAARIAWRHGRAAAIAAASIFAVSYLAIVYASEARGYATMVLCSLATFECAWTWLDTGRRRWLAGATVAALLGLVSQTLFVVGWGAIALAVAARILGDGRGRAGRRILAFAVVPVAASVAWWLLVVRSMFNAGAPPWKLDEVLAQTAAWAFGLPAETWAIVLGSALAFAVLALDARLLAARGDRAWIAQLAVVVIGPVATVLILRDEYLAPRYFLVPLAFWLLSFARWLGRLATTNAAGRVQALALFALFAAGNAVALVPFLTTGRGSHGELVRAIAAIEPREAAAAPIVVTGNYDFNVQALLEWHARTLPGSRRLVYASLAKLPPRGADFVVFDQPRLELDPPASVRVGDRAYELVGVSRHAGPSGSDWAVYRRSDR